MKTEIKEIDVQSKLEVVKTVASILSSICIPIVLAISGYYIQKQVASDGLNKDYVTLAVAVLKDSRDEDLRRWASEVLSSKSEIRYVEGHQLSLIKSVGRYTDANTFGGPSLEWVMNSIISDL